MSQRSVERALGKLVTDEGFRERFFRDPEPACVLAGLHLTAAERAALVRVPHAALARLATRLDDRICRLHVCGEPTEERAR
jgi:hypothetical protein